MPFKDKDKQKEANKAAMQRYRVAEKARVSREGITKQGITPQGPAIDVTRPSADTVAILEHQARFKAKEGIQ